MNHLLLTGSHKAVILFHAYTGSIVDVKELGKVLYKLGYTVYIPLFSGHGTTDIRNVLQYSVDDWCKQSIDAVRFLEMKGYKQIAVFGLSMGGMLAIRLLTKRIPSIIAGGSFNSAIPLEDSSLIQEAFIRFANKLYKDSMGNKEDYDVYIEQHVLKQLEIIQEMTMKTASQLTKIDVPVYIAQSGLDELIPTTSGRVLAQSMPFACVDYHEFDTATHVITFGKNKQEFYESVLYFVNTLDWR